MSFVRFIWGDFVDGAHHKRIAKIFESVACGDRKRVIINLAPRHTKSEFASYLLPAWLLGKYPKKKIMQISNTSELAEGFGRKVRNLVGSEEYREIFPDVELRQDSKAAGRWNTNHGGEYYATGVGGALAGRGADYAIIDDPHTEAEALAAQSNPAIYDKVYEWYTSGPRQRLQPGGSIILVMCMTGDTPVLMAEGYEKPLRDIRPGDKVVTYENEVFSTSVINNWQSSGIDSVYEIQMQSGIIVRANERHPFLVDNNGALLWKRLNQLRTGDLLVSLKGATDPQEQKQNQENAVHANRKTHIIEKTLVPRIESLGFTVNTKVNNALPMGAVNPHTLTICAKHITTELIGRQESIEVHQNRDVLSESKADTGLLSKITNVWPKTKAVSVLSAENFQGKMLEHTGVVNCVLTIATTLEKLEGYCVTTAILPLGTEKRLMCLDKPQNTYQATRDVITSIVYAGEEEVFDVEVDRTENFIANGLVSHNTRWSKRDLTGQIINSAAKNNSTDIWDVIEFPAVLPSGKSLWPEYWSLEALDAVKAEIPNAKWQAQYQQNPTSEEGALIKREWWREWEKEDPPKNIDFILMSWDTAFEKHNKADYSALTVWGVFEYDGDDGEKRPNIIVLDAVKKRVEFPELKQWAIEAYREWNPDGVIIEKRASGAPLIYELRRMGIPVQEYTPTKGNDKISRINSIADIFASGFVWAPQTRWADELIDDVASFPAGEHDDLVDTVSQAMLRFRQGGFVRTSSDEEYEQQNYSRRRRPYY
jgi:predicted phage terminase large subunit-like protein